MKVIYKVSSSKVEVLQNGKDFVEEHFKIIFDNGKYVYKVQFNEILVAREGYISFTDCEENIPKLQSELSELAIGRCFL